MPARPESLHLPRLPEGIDAVLLDELTDPAALPRLKRLFGLGAKLPVIGAIEMMPGARAALEKAPRDRLLPEELISALAEAFWKHADLEAIGALARSRPFSERTGIGSAVPRAPPTRVSRGLRARRSVRPLFPGHDGGTRSTWGPTFSSFRRFVTNGFPTGSTW